MSNGNEYEQGNPGAPPAPTPRHRFGDMIHNQAYAPRYAPKDTRKNDFPFIYRNNLEGSIYLRFVNHPTLLPNGFHYHTTHVVPQTKGEDIKIQCTESYAPDRKCYTCELLKDLDGVGIEADSILKEEILGSRMFQVLLRNSVMYCRTVLLPVIIQGKCTEVPGRNDPSKTYKSYVPARGEYCSGLLSITPDKPSDMYGGFPDRPFHQKLQVLTLTNDDIMEIYTAKAAVNPTEAQQFYTEAMAAVRNPDLFDWQRGSWVLYNRGKKGVPMSLQCQPPSPISQDIITKFLTEDKYPKPLSFGSGGGNKPSTRLSWVESLQAWKYSWVGQELINRHGWDMDLEESECCGLEESNPAIPPRPAAMPDISPDDIPF